MKCLCIITLVILCLGVNRNTYAEIRNGYDAEVKKAQKWIHNLNEIAKGIVSPSQHDKLYYWLKVAHETAEKVQKNHAKTQELIVRLRIIFPELYHEMNTIKDWEGNNTDVFIKVVDKLGGGLYGVTNVNHSVDHPHRYSSEYGDYTVSVRITYRFTWFPRHAMKILVHELGHVRYQVPHLAAYIAFHEDHYQNRYFEGYNPGHHPKDPSHQSVVKTLKTFKQSWKECSSEMKWIAKNQSQKMLAANKDN